MSHLTLYTCRSNQCSSVSHRNTARCERPNGGERISWANRWQGSRDWTSCHARSQGNTTCQSVFVSLRYISRLLWTFMPLWLMTKILKRLIVCCWYSNPKASTDSQICHQILSAKNPPKKN